MNCPNCKIEMLELDKGSKLQRKECLQCGFNCPGNTKEINEFYCWLSVDESGMEGMVGTQRNGVYYVAQHSVKEMAQKLRPDMQQAAEQTGMKMRLAKFVKAGIEEEIGK